MQIIHYVPCNCQLLDSCECGVKPQPPGPHVIVCPSPNTGNRVDHHSEGSTTEPGQVIVQPPPGPGPGPGPPTPSSSGLSTITPIVEEPSTVEKICTESRRAGLKLSFFLANYQFTAFSATLTSQWRLNLLAAVTITNLQHGLRSLLVILVAWPANIFLGKNLTRIFSGISYIIGLILIYNTYPSIVSKLFALGLILVTLGQCMSDILDYKNETEVDDEEEKAYDSFHTCAKLASKNLWLFLKRHWIEIIAFVVAVFIFPGQKKGLLTIIWLLLASYGFNLVGQLCIKLSNDGVDETCGPDVLREAFVTSSKIQAAWTWIRYIWRDTIDKKQLLRTLRLSLVFLPYIIISEVADNYFFQQVQEMNPIHIFGKAMPYQAFALSTQMLTKLVQQLSHFLYTKIDDANVPRSRFYGTLRVGLAMILAIPCFVIASVVETKRWEDTNTSVLLLIPQLIIIAIVDGLASDGMDCFFKLELPDSLGRTYGFLFVKGIESLGKLLTALWNVFWANVTRSDGNPGWLDEKDDCRHRFDRYYSVMAIFADASCIIFVFVAYRYSVKSYKWRS